MRILPYVYLQDVILPFQKNTIAAVGQVGGQFLTAHIQSLVDNLPFCKVNIYRDEKPSFVYLQAIILSLLKKYNCCCWSGRRCIFVGNFIVFGR